MSHRLRAILASLLVVPLVTAATAFTDDRPDARVSGVRGVVMPVKPAAERADHPTQAAQLAAPADREKPWTLQDCRNEFKDVPRGSYEVSADSRFSQCKVMRTTYELQVNGTPAAWADFRVTILQDSHPRDRKISSRVVLDEWDYRWIDLKAYGKLLRSDLTVDITCTGSAGSTCNGKSKATDTETKEVSTWANATGEEDAYAVFDMTSSPRTNPARDSRAKDFLPRDAVSFHSVDQTVTGETSDSVTVKEPLRCDRAAYLNSVGGCVWDRTPLVWWVDYKDYPQYAKHVWDAQYHPTKTHPYGRYPGVKIPGGILPQTPTSGKQLTRLIQGYDDASLRYHRGTANIIRSRFACGSLTRSQGEECDEYPMHSTYEGANYTRRHPNEPWKYSVRFIDGQQNGDAGSDLLSWYFSRHVLGKGDEFYVSPYNVPSDRQLTSTPQKIAPRPAATRLSEKERAAAPIPSRDLCTNPRLGGRYSCEYGEEWHVYANGRKEVWVIGADRQVYHNYSRSNGSMTGWLPFGGIATSGVQVVLDESRGQAATIRVRGTDGKFHHRERNGKTGVWTPWHVR